MNERGNAMLHTDVPYYTQLHHALSDLLRDIGQVFPRHSVFFATHDGVTNAIRQVDDQVGLAIPEGYTEPFQQSLCRLAAAATAKMVAIPDLTAHADTRSHPFTLQYGTGSFLGAAVTRPDGSTMGSLCLISDEPYFFTDREEKWMGSLARVVSEVVRMEKGQVRDGLTHQYHANVLPPMFQEMVAREAEILFFVISINDFQWINQQHGCEQGDQLLRTFAQVLQEEFSAKAVPSRIEPDTFLVMLPYAEDEHPEHRASTLASRFLHHIHGTPFRMKDRDQYVQINMCISYYPKEDTHFEHCLETARKRMKRAKQLPAGEHVVDSDEALLVSEREFRLRNDLNHDGLYQQLCLQYQPQVHLSERSMQGVEALVRWNHPTYGWLAPNIWIPIAEAYGHIHAIGKWVIRQGCIDMLAYGARHEPIDLAVNISPLQLREADFAEQVLAIVTEVAFPADRLVLEITETLLLEDHAHVMKNLQTLRSRGIRIAIDDFGVGYASFHLLHKFPIDILKIDRQLSRPLTSPANKKIVSALLELAYSLGMHCIVEGIETAEQHAFYQQYDNYWGQGYYYHRPVSPDELPAL